LGEVAFGVTLRQVEIAIIIAIIAVRWERVGRLGPKAYHSARANSSTGLLSYLLLQ